MTSNRDSSFLPELREIRLVIYCILSLWPRQLPLKVSNETNNCLHITRIDRNLQCHRSVSLRQHGFLVLMYDAAIYANNDVYIRHS